MNALTREARVLWATLLLLFAATPAAAQIGGSAAGMGAAEADEAEEARLPWLEEEEEEFDDSSMVPESLRAEAEAAVARVQAEEAAAARVIIDPDNLVDENPFIVADIPTMQGYTGLFRMPTASALRAKTFGVGFFIEYMSANDFIEEGDSQRRFNGHVGFSWAPISKIEVFAYVNARSATNSSAEPSLVQSVGNFGIGVKGFQPINDMVSVGLMANFMLPAGADQVGASFSSIGAEIAAMSTFDFNSMNIPMRLHFNAGFILDSSDNLFEVELTPIERYGQGVYGYNRVRTALGLDFAVERLTPFAELTLDIPVDAPCSELSLQPCVSDEGFSSFPLYATLGVRASPAKRLMIHAGVDLGLTSTETQGTPAAPLWNLFFGLTYNIDPVTRERVVEVDTPVTSQQYAPTTHVTGRLVDQITGAPLVGAQVSYPDTTYTTQITGEDGSFQTPNQMPQTELAVVITHPDYTTREMTVTYFPQHAEGDIEMVHRLRTSGSTGRVNLDAEDVDAIVSFHGQDADYQEVVTDENGEFAVALVPGIYTVIAAAPGHRAERYRFIEVTDEIRPNIVFNLHSNGPLEQARLERDAVVFDHDRVFEFDGDDITDESEELLTQVAIVMSRYPQETFLIRCHTDATSASRDESRARRRCNNVRRQLVALGVNGNLLETEAVGGTEPRHPNSNDRNRARNNRFEFLILNTDTIYPEDGDGETHDVTAEPRRIDGSSRDDDDDDDDDADDDEPAPINRMDLIRRNR